MIGCSLYELREDASSQTRARRVEQEPAPFFFYPAPEIDMDEKLETSMF